MNKRAITYIVSAMIILAVAIFISFWLGHFPISFLEYKSIIMYKLGFKVNLAHLSKLDEITIIFRDIRFPRIAAAVLIGASLSVSGAVFQGMFVNPLVSPGILGVLSGASFGAALGMVLRLPWWSVQISAFIFGFIAVFLALTIAKFYGKGNGILMLVLDGVISSSLFGAFVSLLKYVADPYDTLPSIVYWMMGSLSSVNLFEAWIAASLVTLSLVGILIFSKHLNLLSLGEEDAKALGVDVFKTRFFIIFLATLLSAVSVMLAGVIGWIGLVVPHVARFLIGANHVVLLPFSALIGAIFLLVVDSISRSLFSVEVPLGILTSLVGIPVFIWALHRNVKAH